MRNARARRIGLAGLAGFISSVALATAAGAQTLPPQERLCDPTFQDCRADILTYIRQETVGIDMAFWMMTDARYSNELVNAWQRGVRIRLLMDPRCSGAHPACTAQNDQLRAAGIPMRNRAAGGILHWKAAIFAGQGQLQFSGANYAPFELSPEQPFVNFTDEVVYFTNDPSLVRSFMTKFDDLWTSTTEFANYANVSGPLTRLYPRNAIDPELNFAPDESYRSRSLTAYSAEQQKIDVMMFRITDETHTDAMIQAHTRGIPIRLITDETEYRNPARLWHAYNVDKLFNAGVQVRIDAHQGLNHAKAVMLHGSGLSIFGSSNWTSPSSDTQREHNYFTRKPWIFSWLTALFDRKWGNQTGFWETRPFAPLPPDLPAVAAPANGAAGVATTGVSLTWYAGPWAHNYDIYFGATPNPPLMAANRRLGPSQSSTDYRTFSVPTLLPGTRYYWRVVSKTMAFVAAEGPLWSFVTAGTPPPRVDAISSSVPSPMPAGAAVTWTAVASGGVAPLQYKFVRLDLDGWKVVQEYSAANTYTWIPGADQVGSHALQVWVRSQGSSAMYDNWAGTVFSVSGAAALAVTSLTAGTALPAPAGTPIVFTATTTGGRAPLQFKFLRRDADGWHVAREYGTSPTYTYTPGAGDVGDHDLQVWVRNAGSSALYDAWRGISFTVAPSSVVVSSLQANVSFPVRRGTSITWTATASGGIGPLQYQFIRLDADGWRVVQPYGTSSRYTWTPGRNDVGTHALQVWVRSAGSTAAYEAWRATGMFTVQ